MLSRNIMIGVLSVAAFVGLGGCRSAQKKNSKPPVIALKTPFPARPSVAPPAVRVFHQSENTITLVTKPDATDDEIAAVVWELRHAASTHGFAALGIPQKVVDARKPILWFHLYRGPKCASEKYADKLPCGASYHAAGEFTLGSYADPDWSDGELLHHANGGDQETQLWTSDGPKRAAATSGVAQ